MIPYPGIIMTKFNDIPVNLERFVKRMQHDIGPHLATVTPKWAPSGIETNPHVTLTDLPAGLSVEQEADMLNFIQTRMPLEIVFNKIGCFHATDWDVVILLADKTLSKKLMDLQQDFIEKFEITPTFPVYNPHLTIGYVEPNQGSRFVGKMKEQVYSPSDFFIDHFDD